MPLSTFATLRTTAEPRELKKFQQLNAVRVQGVDSAGASRSTRALSFLEDEARAILPPGVHASTTPASRASFARRAAAFSAPSCCRRS